MNTYAERRLNMYEALAEQFCQPVDKFVSSLKCYQKTYINGNLATKGEVRELEALARVGSITMYAKIVGDCIYYTTL